MSLLQDSAAGRFRVLGRAVFDLFAFCVVVCIFVSFSEVCIDVLRCCCTAGKMNMEFQLVLDTNDNIFWTTCSFVLFFLFSTARIADL